MRGILDTSVFVATETGRPLDEEPIPDEVAVSIVTLAELALGVHLAQTDSERAQRLRTLQAVQSTYEALPADERVASVFAELVATVRRGGRRATVQDTWIAATAVAHGAAIYTQDDDFDAFGVEVVRV